VGTVLSEFELIENRPHFYVANQIIGSYFSIV